MGNRLETVVVGGGVISVSAAIGLALWAGLGMLWPFALVAGVAAAAIQFFVVSRVARKTTPAKRRRSSSNSIEPMPAAGVQPDAAILARVEAVEAGLRMVAKRVWEIDQRVTDLNRQVIEQTRDTVAAVASELDMVGSVVRDLAEAVALHEAELFSGPAQPSLPQTPRPLQATRSEPIDSKAPAVEPPAQRVVPPAIAPEQAAPVPAAPMPAAVPPTAPVAEPVAPPAPPPPAEPQPPREASNTTKRAVVTGVGIELFLQSVVTLPQRKIRLYEALPRVKEPEGGVTQGDDLAEVAWRLGVGAVYDTAVLRQVVKVIRHLAARERDVGVICPVALSSLSERGYFEVLSDLVSEGQAVGTRLVLRLRHDAFMMAAPAQTEAMEAVRALGVKLLVDGVEDLRIDPHGLARRGVRFIKVPAVLLLAAAEGTAPAEIHPADLAGFLTRQGVAMIVCDVENEEMALELMDFGATLGQGDVFAGPRPVRQDVITQDPPPLPVAAPPASEPAPAPSQPAASAAASTPQRASLRSFLRRTTA